LVPVPVFYFLKKLRTGRDWSGLVLTDLISRRSRWAAGHIKSVTVCVTTWYGLLHYANLIREKHNPIIDWMEKTLEFRNSQEDKAKAFIQSLAQEQEETTLIEDKDLMVWYLKSHRGPEPSDQLYTLLQHGMDSYIMQT
jgi:hypothetical protein